MSYSLGCRLLLIACGLLLIAEAAQADGAGRWRMPSTCAQYFGYGYGPGHQAPMIRSPGYASHRVPRIVVIPARECPYSYAGYSTYGDTPNADAWNCDALVMPEARPSHSGYANQGVPVVPTLAPQPAAVAASSGMSRVAPLFGAPQPPARQYAAESSKGPGDEAQANDNGKLLKVEEEVAATPEEEPAGAARPRPEAANPLDRSAMHIDGIQILDVQ